VAKQVAFITGIAGFAGSWLAEELLAHGYKVTGALYDNEPTTNLADCVDRLELVSLDLTDPSRTETIIGQIKPDVIFHLAAIASVGKSFAAERLTYRVNFEATLNVLQAAEKLPRLKKMVFTSSSDTYGVFSPVNKTLAENQRQAPISPYGISKVAAEQLCRYYLRGHSVPCTIARSFNHSGPRQTDDFVIPAFARQVAAINLDRQAPVMKVGDLSARRDFSDVRDIVRGYRLLAEKGQPGRAYHLCAGRAVAIERMLDTLRGFCKRSIKVTVDRARLRKNDIPVMRGSNRRAVQELGYAVRYSLKQTLRDTFDFWKTNLSSGD